MSSIRCLCAATWRRLLTAVVAIVLVTSISQIRVVHADAYTYDGTAVARVETGVATATRSASPEVSDRPTRRVESSSATWGTSTTPGRSFLATNNVSSILDSLPRGRQSNVRTVESDADLQDLFDLFSAGGTPVSRPSYDGQWYQLEDGCQVGIRNDSNSGGRTIDVRSPDGRIWKVHIV